MPAGCCTCDCLPWRAGSLLDVGDGTAIGDHIGDEEHGNSWFDERMLSGAGIGAGEPSGPSGVGFKLDA